jgi:hypothetical protein
MTRILYLTTSETDPVVLDPSVAERMGKLADGHSVDIVKLHDIGKLNNIDIKNYTLVIFDPAFSIPPWHVINHIREKLGNQLEPSYWVEGDLNKITKTFLEAEGLSGSVYVERNSKELIAACNGDIDGQLNNDNPINIKTQHNICSIGKMLTGLVVYKLVQDGKISLDALINDYLPDDFPGKKDGRWETSTLKQLLTHTAGMGNYTKKYNEVLNSSQVAPRFNRLADFTDYIEHPEDIKPNQFLYSNVGFIVL